MTLTIADRWSVTFRVQSLARVTMPAPVVTAREPEESDAALIQQTQADLAADRVRWETEAFFCGSRRMF